MSVAGGLPRSVQRAVVHHCDAFQIFAKNGNQSDGWRTETPWCNTTTRLATATFPMSRSKDALQAVADRTTVGAVIVFSELALAASSRKVH